MPDKFQIILHALDENKKAILADVSKESIFAGASKQYLKPKKNIISKGEDVINTAENILSGNQSVIYLSDKPVLTPPSSKNGVNNSVSSFFPETKTDGTLKYVTRYDIKNITDDSNTFRKVSFSFRGLSPRVTFRNASNEAIIVSAGEKVGISYQKKGGYNNSSEIKADCNVFSGRVTLGGYYKTPNESVNASVFYKNGNYGITAGYSNDMYGLSFKGAVDKKGAALNVRFDKEYKDCYTSVGAYASSEYKTVGVTGRVTF